MNKDVSSKYVEAHGILSEEQDGFQPLPMHHPRSPRLSYHDDGGRQNLQNDIYIMYVDLKGAFNAAHDRITLKHMRQLAMPPSFVATCEQLYRVTSTNYITPAGPPRP
jgi:hypothetical protein